eukprot:TRINITY_DN55396_c0_g1_i1.p1 TRINITY_DN55396_c0_g1~~TRINITY_DN55396_c0_g1_i1.p1  ORF type:complete len:186 (-),score=16.71 TRINITY_DN55396_c0_g1_i1:199-756(-)
MRLACWCSVVAWLMLLDGVASSVADDEDIEASSFSRGYNAPGGSYGPSQPARNLASDGFVVCPGQGASGGGGSGGSGGGGGKMWMCGNWSKTCDHCKASCPQGIGTTGVYSRTVKCADENKPANCKADKPPVYSSGLTEAVAATYNITPKCPCAGCAVISHTIGSELTMITLILCAATVFRSLGL